MPPRYKNPDHGDEEDNTVSQDSYHRENGDRLRDYRLDEMQRDLRNLGVMVREGLERIERKLETSLGDILKKLGDHESRINAVEKWQEDIQEDDLQNRVKGNEVFIRWIGAILMIVGGLALGTLWGIPFGGS